MVYCMLSVAGLGTCEVCVFAPVQHGMPAELGELRLTHTQLAVLHLLCNCVEQPCKQMLKPYLLQ